MRKSSIFTLLFLTVCLLQTNAQYTEQNTTYDRYFVGSTLAMLGNFDTHNSPDFVQLNFGYRITGVDVVSIELKTWKYAWSLGIPYSDSFEADNEKFPGYIREYGFALVYQRFLWEGLYAGIHVMNAFQTFVDESGNKIDNGFQIFNTYRVGYHIKLFGDKFFFEPSLAITQRAYHTEMPESFKQLDDQWGKFFFGEPGLHFGYNF